MQEPRGDQIVWSRYWVWRQGVKANRSGHVVAETTASAQKHEKPPFAGGFWPRLAAC